MPDPTLISDRLSPQWNSLTDEQKTMLIAEREHPAIVNQENKQAFINIWQHFVRLNSNTAVIDPPVYCPTCIHVRQIPLPIPLYGQAWIKQSLLANGETSRFGKAFLTIYQNSDPDVIIKITQYYGVKTIPGKRPPRIRHVRLIPPLGTGDFDLTVHDGYFATTDGNNRYAQITGRGAARRPDKPMGAIKLTSTQNGKWIWQTIPNPYAGSRAPIRRPLHYP